MHEQLERDLRGGLADLLDPIAGSHPSWEASPAAARMHTVAVSSWRTGRLGVARAVAIAAAAALVVAVGGAGLVANRGGGMSGGGAAPAVAPTSRPTATPDASATPIPGHDACMPFDPAATAAPVPLSSGPAATLTVTIDHLGGSVGSCLAVVLHGLDRPADGVGGFRAPVDADPFSITEPVRSGSPIRSPAVGPVAQVPAGRYALAVYLSTYLRPYSEWVPAVPVDRACTTTVSISPEGGSQTITIAGASLVAGEDGSMPAEAMCQVLERLPPR